MAPDQQRFFRATVSKATAAIWIVNLHQESEKKNYHQDQKDTQKTQQDHI